MRKNIALLLGMVVITAVLGSVTPKPCFASQEAHAPADQASFPRALDSYHDGELSGVVEILKHRVQEEPFNLVATLFFLLAIIHTFLTSRFTAISHRMEHAHEERIEQGLAERGSVSVGAGVFHFLGEVEAVFGLWVVPLAVVIIVSFDWSTAISYLSHTVNFTEPAFVVVIMVLAATRPILRLAEAAMGYVAGLMGGSLAAWWITILTLGPVLGSLITEPAAMTISALLIGKKIFALGPSTRFKYATVGLLFVNVSVGGTLTHFAAPPVLMVAGTWGWGMGHMVSQFGWKALTGILIANAAYFLFLRGEMARLQQQFARLSLKNQLQRRYMRRQDLEGEFEEELDRMGQELKLAEAPGPLMLKIRDRIRDKLGDRYLPEIKQRGVDLEVVREAFNERFDEIRRQMLQKHLPGLLPRALRPEIIDPHWDQRDDPVPVWITLVHVLFMVFTIINAHHAPLFVLGLLFFLGFAAVTGPFQNHTNLKPPMLVGFFLAGLVIHGGLQGWWIAPVLGSLGELPLMLSATVLTAFNDNAAITFLSTLVPGFTDGLKYAVVAGAVTGGGLTVIANAPNPAGQSILKRYFAAGVSPVGLLAGAVAPTVIMFLCFLVFR